MSYQDAAAAVAWFVVFVLLSIFLAQHQGCIH